jgi:hypothetical protein
MGRGASAPHQMEDSDALVRDVHDLFAKLSKDGTWNKNADREFVRSVSRMSQAGQVRELAMVAAKVNKGELKVVPEPQAEPKPQKSQK